MWNLFGGRSEPMRREALHTGSPGSETVIGEQDLLQKGGSMRHVSIDWHIVRHMDSEWEEGLQEKQTFLSQSALQPC